MKPLINCFPISFKWIHHWVGRGLWRVGEVWGDDSLSEEVDDVREDCRWTVLWKSLLLISTTREKRRSWKWLKEWKTQMWSVTRALTENIFKKSFFHTHYSFVGVLASLALMMNRGKRMENKQPLGRRERTKNIAYSKCSEGYFSPLRTWALFSRVASRSFNVPTCFVVFSKYSTIYLCFLNSTYQRIQADKTFCLETGCDPSIAYLKQKCNFFMCYKGLTKYS